MSGPSNGAENTENLPESVGEKGETANSVCSLARALMLFKKVLDYAVIIPALLTNYVDAIPVCFSILAVGLAALTVDFFSVRFRQSAGLPAVWPKLIPVVFVLVYSLCLSLLCVGLFSEDDFREWSGVLSSGAFATMAILSVIVGRPFVHADVIEVVSVEQLRQWETSPTFMSVMNAVSGLWGCIFIAQAVIHLIAMKFYAEGNLLASTLTNAIAPWLIVFTGLKCIQPRLIARVKERRSTDSQTPEP